MPETGCEASPSARNRAAKLCPGARNRMRGWSGIQKPDCEASLGGPRVYFTTRDATFSHGTAGEGMCVAAETWQSSTATAGEGMCVTTETRPLHRLGQLGEC